LQECAGFVEQDGFLVMKNIDAALLTKISNSLDTEIAKLWVSIRVYSMNNIWSIKVSHSELNQLFDKFYIHKLKYW